MPKESDVIQRVRAFDEAANFERDFDKAMKYCMPDVRVRESKYLPYRAPFVGRQGLIELMQDVDKWWSFPRPLTFDFFEISASLVIGRITGPAIVRPTGLRVDFNCTEWITLVDGRIQDIEVFYFDAVPLLEAAQLLGGLSCD